ncbi:MAG: hypothetical protein IT372_35100 [Polyangiaceae bacterium]|nr:hypothetical protein [Polyangiaceae bacterium]
MRRSIGVVIALASLSSLIAHRALGAPPEAAGVTRDVTPAPSEIPAIARQGVERMEAVGAGIREELRVTRAQRDVVKALCLSDKLTQIDVAIRAARERRQAAELALARSDTDQAAHELTILVALRQRADALRAEANQCLGTPDIIDEDRSVVDQSGDPGLPEEAVDYRGADVFIEPPSCVSCFR